MSPETTITESDFGRFKKYIAEMEAAGWIVKPANEGRWVPEGEACCGPAAQISHVQSQGGKIHLGLGERCEDNVAPVEPDGTDAGALAVILDEAKNGPWKPDDGTSLWFVNEAGDQLHLTGDDVALLLGRCDCVCARHG